MSADALPPIVQEMPISLRQEGDKWEILCAGRTPLILPVDAAPAILATVRRALDQRKILHFQLVPGTGNVVTLIKEQLPAGLPEEVLRWAPALPASVTAREVGDDIPKDPAEYTEDRVLWVTPMPTNRVIRFTFEIQAAPYYLPEVHPRKEEILAAAAISIQDGRPIRVAISGQYILDLILPLERDR